MSESKTPTKPLSLRLHLLDIHSLNLSRIQREIMRSASEDAWELELALTAKEAECAKLKDKLALLEPKGGERYVPPPEFTDEPKSASEILAHLHAVLGLDAAKEKGNG